MSKRLFLLLPILALLGTAGTVTRPGVYEIKLKQPVVVSGVTLRAGDYKMSVADTRVTITPADGGKPVEAAVKIEDASKKFENTTITYDEANNQRVISEIDLGGRKTKLIFVQ